MYIKTVIVVNDTANNNLLAKHGLSIFIDIGSSKILFDCGPDATIIKNLISLKIDVKNINLIIISHGHYDHIGGLEFILKNNKIARVHAHPQVLLNRYKIEGQKVVNVGCTQSCKKNILKLPIQRLAFETHPVKFSSFIGLSGEIINTLRENKTNSLNNLQQNLNTNNILSQLSLFTIPTNIKYFLDKKCKTVDTNQDEQALWIKHEKGLIIFTGCCHVGLPNIIEQVKKVSKEDKVYGIIGGFHFKSGDLNSNYLYKVLEYLSYQNPLSKIVACHCMDELSTKILKEKFSNRVLLAKAGDEIIW